MRLLIVCLLLVAGLAHAQQPSNGQVSEKNGKRLAWDEASASWVTLDQFWQNYAASKGGLTWGHGSEYPEYEKVSEFDTFLVKVPQGDCLMEFFHSRWRRANDVRRWDPFFNQYSGCPHVFD